MKNLARNDCKCSPAAEPVPKQEAPLLVFEHIEKQLQTNNDLLDRLQAKLAPILNEGPVATDKQELCKSKADNHSAIVGNLWRIEEGLQGRNDRLAYLIAIIEL